MAGTAVTAFSEKLYFGRDAAADALDISTRVLDDAIRDGTLEAYRIGRRVLIRRDALIRFAERKAANCAPAPPRRNLGVNAVTTTDKLFPDAPHLDLG